MGGILASRVFCAGNLWESRGKMVDITIPYNVNPGLINPRLLNWEGTI